MQFRRDELVIFLPRVFNEAFVVRADLTVQDLEAQSMAACSEMEHDQILGFEVVLVGLCF